MILMLLLLKIRLVPIRRILYLRPALGPGLSLPLTNPQVTEVIYLLAQEDRIAGLFFIGTPALDLEERPRPAPSDIVRQWP